MLSDPTSSFGHFLVQDFLRPRADIINITGKHSLYKPGELLGKSTAQIGRANDGAILANDSDLYEKWSQCVNSAAQLVRRTYWDGDKDDDAEIGDGFYSTVFPFVVVPNGRLWAVSYDENGLRTSPPTQVDRCSLFIDKDYEMSDSKSVVRMVLTHVELVTFDGLLNFLNAYLKTKEGMEQVFPGAAIEYALLTRPLED